MCKRLVFLVILVILAISMACDDFDNEAVVCRRECTVDEVLDQPRYQICMEYDQ